MHMQNLVDLRRKTVLSLLLLAVPLLPVHAGAEQEKVTLEQVLAAPDDAGLNYRYAVSQVAAGELLSALSALERVMTAAPFNYEAVLVHALVLYRLENLQGASRELEAMERLPLSPALRSDIRRLQTRIKRRLSGLQFSGQLGAGYEHNTNRNSFPASGKASLSGTPIDLDAGPHKADNNVVMTGGISGKQDLGSQKGHELAESFTWYRTEQNSVKDLNLDAYSLRVSGRFRAAPADIALSLLYDDLRLARESYLVGAGAGLRLERRVGRTGVYLDGKYTDHKFAKNPVSPGARDRDGAESEVSLGADQQLIPSMKIGLEYGYAYKNAKESIYTYAKNSLGLNHVWFLGGGTYLESSVNCSLENYPHPNFFVSRRLRKDTLVKAGVSYGVPLGVLSRRLSDFLSSFTAEVQDSRSTIINYTFRNYKLAALVTYKWQAGF